MPGKMGPRLVAVFVGGSVLSSLACSSPPAEQRPAATTASPALEPAVARELERHGIQPKGAPREFSETLPADLMAGAAWGTKVGVCRGGGYDLGSAAGHPVRLLRFDIDQRARGEALYAWVVVDGERVACVYRSVRENSAMAPGVFAASGP